MVGKVEKIILLVKNGPDSPECTQQCGFRLEGHCLLDNIITDSNGYPRHFAPVRDPHLPGSQACPAEGAYKVTIERWSWLS